MMKVHFTFSILVAGLVYSAVSMKSRIPEVTHDSPVRVREPTPPQQALRKKKHSEKDAYRHAKKQHRKHRRNKRWRRIFNE